MTGRRALLQPVAGSRFLSNKRLGFSWTRLSLSTAAAHGFHRMRKRLTRQQLRIIDTSECRTVHLYANKRTYR